LVREIAKPLIGSGRLGLLPAAFNPPTLAHLALARAAAGQHELDQVVLVLPANLPHKGFEDADFEERTAMLAGAVEDADGVTAAVCRGGLFHEVAAEFQALPGELEIALIAGRDAAERIVGWDYGDGPSIREQLAGFELLVAPRNGPYRAPEELAARVKGIELDPRWEAISSSAVRGAIAEGDPDWSKALPAGTVDVIRAAGLYGCTDADG